MGNIICFNENTPVDDWICMSNMATDVFINVLLLSGTGRNSRRKAVNCVAGRKRPKICWSWNSWI